MENLKYIAFVICACCFLMTACNSDPENTTTEIAVSSLLTGHWELAQGIRNGKVAPTMEGTYFTFNTNNSMVTNMMGSDQTSVYNLNDRVITQSKDGIKTEYKVENITTDSLRLTTTIRGFNFDLSMLKAEKPANLNPET